MKETKVYIDELPESCTDCPCYDFDMGGCQCKDPHFTYDSINRFKGCPLIDIKIHDRELVNELIEIKHKLEQELAEYKKYKEWQEQLDCKNADELIDFVMSNYLTEDEKCKTIKELNKQLAGLKEKAIVPRFKFDEECVVIMFGSYHFHRFIAQVKDDLCLTQPYNDTEEWYYVKPEMVFKTLEEAQAKLKEIQENE